GAARELAVTVPVPVDHAPTWVLPALPMMSMAMLALAAAGQSGLVEGVALRWLTFPDGPRTVHAHVEGARVSLSAGHGHAFFHARVGTPAFGEPAPLEAPEAGETGEELY